MRLARVAIASIGAVVLLVTGAIVFTGRGGSVPAPPEGRALRPSSTALTPLVPGGSLEDQIVGLQDRLARLPGDWQGLASLGLAYVAEARVTADPTYYSKAEGALERSLRARTGGNVGALVGLGALALARHDFAGALDWGERARALDHYDADAYGVIGDAQVELGRYDDAFSTFQKMVNTRPDLSSYARVSYARELVGDVAGAIDAMKMALDSAGTPSDAAWASFQLGELYWNGGRVSAAAQAYRRARELAPEYVPPLAGLGKVAWARRELDRAIERFTEVVARYPSPEYVIALGDLHRLAGDADAAEQQDALVRAEEKLFRANGVNVDLEQALFETDHGDPRAGLAAVRAEWARRHSVQVADAYAWALSANGMNAKAEVYERKALALGMRNALFLFHAGMIQRRLGHDGAARVLLRRALATNPNFSIRYAATARRTLNTLVGRA
jgi:tetratricopeptide (TPR) repeat protein